MASGAADDVSQASRVGVTRDRDALRRAVVLAAVFLATLLDQDASALVAIDSYVEGAFGLSADQIAQLNIADTSAYWSGILISPFLQQRFGADRHYIVSLLALGMISSQHAFAGSLPSLILHRAVFGFAEGGIFINSVAIMFRTIKPPEIPYALALFALMNLLGPSLAQFLAGVATDYYSWRALYEWGTPFAILAAGLILLFAREPPKVQSRKPPLDIVGIGLALVAIIGFELMASYGEQRDWFNDPLTVIWLALTIISTIAFLLWEMHYARFPFEHMHVLTLRNVAVGLPLAFIVGAALFGTSSFTGYLERQLGFSPSVAGGIVALRLAPLFFFAPAAMLTALFGLVETRIIIAFGFLCLFASFLIEASHINYFADSTSFVLAITVSGVGFGCAFGPLLAGVMRSVEPAVIPYAASLIKFALVLGGAVGTLVVNQVFYDRRLAFHAAIFTQESATHTGVSPADATAIVQSQASISATQDTFFVFAAIVLFALVFVPFIKPPPPINAAKKAS